MAGRDNRVASLFTNPTVQALRENSQRIVRESARYNYLGQGNINVPPFALMFLRPINVGRFRFRAPRAATIADTRVWEVQYAESAKPTIIKDQDLVSDAPADGAFWIRESDGAILRSLVHTGSTAYDSRVRVDYCHAAGIDILVPCAMFERYTTGKLRSFGEAHYSDIRQFGVTTSTDLKGP